MKFLFIFALFMGGFCCLPAWADIYTCKNAAGHTLTSDRPIQECADRAMLVRQSVHQKAREIPRPLTAEERRKLEAEQEKQKAEAQLEELRKKDELYLQSNFKSESDIELARQQLLETVKEKINVGNEQIKAIGRILTELQEEQQENSSKSPTENAELQRRAGQLALSVKNTRSTIERYEAEQVRINAQYDDILRRYREIVLKRKK